MACLRRVEMVESGMRHLVAESVPVTTTLRLGRLLTPFRA